MTAAALEFTILMDTGNLSRSMDQARRSVADGMRGMARAAQEEALRLHSALAGITGFRELKQGVAEARGEWSKAQGEVTRLAAAIGAVATPTRAMQREFEKAKQTASEVKSAFEAKRESLQRLRGELRSAGIDTANLVEEQRRLRQELVQSAEKLRQQQRLHSARELIGLAPSPNTVRELARVQAAYERLRLSGTMTTAELSRAHLAMTTRIVELKNGTETWASRLALVREQLAKLAVAGTAIGLAVREAIRFESAMADVRKVVDFPTHGAFVEMTNDIKQMSREIPMPLEGLAKIAEAGGQMGIVAKDIKGFTEVVAKMSTAFKISPDEAGTAIGKLMNIFHLTIPETNLLGDAINHLGNNTNAVERNILEVMNRIGGMAKIFGLANSETAALAATFLALGRPPEIAATGINALLLTLQTAPTREGEFKQALQRIGFSAEQLASDIAKHPQQTLMRFLETLRGLDKQTQANTLVQLFGREYADDLAIVIAGLDKYKEILGLVGKESNYAGSMQKEFGERIRTTEAQLQLAKNAISEAAVNLGNAFLPALVAVAKAVAALMHGLAALIEQFPNLSAAAVTALTAFTGFGALRLVWSALRTGVIAMLAPLATLGTAVRGLLFTPLGALLTAAGVAAYALAKATSSTVPPLLENATALGKSREATAEKIKAIEALKKSLESSKPGTREHTEAEEKLAAILPNANLSLDEQGRVLARVGHAASDNAGKLNAYLDLLKKEERQTLALQLDAQARAFGEAKKEMASYSDGLRTWYGLGTEQAQSASQRFWLWLNKLTGTYDDNIAKGAELRRQLGDTEGGMKALLLEARKAALSVGDLGQAMEAIHADPAVREQVVTLYRALAKEAEAAATKTVNFNDSLKQFSLAIAAPAAAARKVIVEAIGGAEQQLGKYNEAISQNREKLKQAVDDEANSWKFMGEIAATSSRRTTERIGEEYDRRERRLEALAEAGLLSERRTVQAIIQLTIQENEARLTERRRYQTESLSLLQQEYQLRMENAKRLNIDAIRVDEEMLQAKKRILEQTEADYRGTIDKLIAEEKRHLETARQIDEQRLGFRASVEDRLARLAEKSLDPAQTYALRQTRIAQEQALAEEALRAGNYASARRHAEKMMELAEQNANAVKVGNKVILSEQEAVTKAEEQVRKAAILADQSFQSQSDTHRQAAMALHGEYSRMAGQMEKVRGAIMALDQEMAKEHKILIQTDTTKVEAAVKLLDNLLERKEQVTKIKEELQETARALEGIPEQVTNGLIAPVEAGLDKLKETFTRFRDEFGKWDPEIKEKFDLLSATSLIDNFINKFNEFRTSIQAVSTITINADTARAVAALEEVTARANALDGRVITYQVQQVTREAYAGGGPVGLARGGRLPGFGGGDRIQALLEAGEFVIRKEAVRRYGLGLLESLNRMHLRLPEMPRFAAGGLVRNLVIPALPSLPALAGGGMVSPPVEVMRLDLTFGGQPAASITAPRDQVRGLVNALKELQRGLA